MCMTSYLALSCEFGMSIYAFMHAKCIYACKSAFTHAKNAFMNAKNAFINAKNAFMHAKNAFMHFKMVCSFLL